MPLAKREARSGPVVQSMGTRYCTLLAGMALDLPFCSAPLLTSTCCTGEEVGIKGDGVVLDREMEKRLTAYFYLVLKSYEKVFDMHRFRDISL